MRAMILLISYTKCAVEKVVWRVLLPFIQSELVTISSIKLTMALESSLISQGETRPPPSFRES